jgi:DNA polymerase-3 subunit epsilon
MQYLAIDLEACNRYVRGSVFSVGYVLADENFNVIKKEDIIINPKCKFVAKFRKPIAFSVTKEQAEAAPTFAEQYEKIAALFQKDTIVLAHSANSDMFMLNEACKRARVPALKFKYICTQMIYSAIYDVMNGIGLDKAAEEMGVSFTHHKADDDALMALLLLKSCCEKMGCTYLQLEKKLGIKRGVNQNYTFVPMHCAKLETLRQMHRQQKKQEQKELQRELRTKHNLAIELDLRTFDAVRCGMNSICTVNDNLVRQLSVGSTVYLVKHTGNLEVCKVEVQKVECYSSYLELYVSVDKKDTLVRNETELDFLERMYSTNDAIKEKEYGVAVITFRILHTHDNAE